ncbi:MAG: hypothetical protein P8099_12925 [Gemmatimonadota bacterium]|jgi:hypothetical protein
MSMKIVRRILLVVPLAMAVACSTSGNSRYPDPTGPNKPGDSPPKNGTTLPTSPDTLPIAFPTD